MYPSIICIRTVHSNRNLAAMAAGMGYTHKPVRSWDGDNPIISFYLFIYLTVV